MIEQLCELVGSCIRVAVEVSASVPGSSPGRGHCAGFSLKFEVGGW